MIETALFFFLAAAMVLISLLCKGKTYGAGKSATDNRAA
jgi:hypothetical protein